jgi:tetratricopeptide (TPR) repeat protein
MPSGLGLAADAVDPKDFVDTYERLASAKSKRYEGNLSEARALADEVLRERPESLWANNVAGLVAFDQNRLEDAQQYFTRVLGILDARRESDERRYDFEIAEAHDHLGRVLLRSGDVARAMEELETAVKLQPDFAVFRNNLGSSLLNLGYVEPAIEHLEEAVRLRPSYASAHKNLGIAFLKRRDWSRARERFETALSLSPDYVDARYGLGHCLAYQNDFRGAAEQFSRVLELTPGHDQARADLARVNEILRQRAEGSR